MKCHAALLAEDSAAGPSRQEQGVVLEGEKMVKQPSSRLRTPGNINIAQNSSLTRFWLAGAIGNLMNSCACRIRLDVTACMAELTAGWDMPPIELRGCWNDPLAKKCSPAVTLTATGSAYGQYAFVSRSSARR